MLPGHAFSSCKSFVNSEDKNKTEFEIQIKILPIFKFCLNLSDRTNEPKVFGKRRTISVMVIWCYCLSLLNDVLR